MGVGEPAKEPVQHFPGSDNGVSFLRRTTRKREAEQSTEDHVWSWAAGDQNSFCRVSLLKVAKAARSIRKVNLQNSSASLRLVYTASMGTCAEEILTGK